MIKYRVEIFEDNHWRLKSTHTKQSDAIFKADRIFKNRKCDVRVIYMGNIIMAYYGGGNKDENQESND